MRVSVMTVARSLTDLIGMHDRQLIGDKSCNDCIDGRHSLTVGKVDLDANIGESAHRPSPHASHDYCLNIGIMQNLNGNQTATRIMRTVCYCFHASNCICFIQIDHRKDLAVAEVIGPLSLKSTGILGGNCNSHMTSP